MADYNIYIHSIGNGGQNENPTKAWGAETKNSFTSAWKDESTGYNDPSTNVAPFIANEAMSALRYGKTATAIAVAAVVIKTGWQAINVASGFVAAENGDYRVATQLANFKASVNAVSHPVSTTLNALKQDLEIKRENTRREMQRELLGESDINTYTNRGY